MTQINKKNMKSLEMDNVNTDIEARSLLNMHSEIKTQEDNLVQARRLGHNSLAVGNQLKSTLNRQTRTLENNIYKNDKVVSELKTSDRIMLYLR